MTIHACLFALALLLSNALRAADGDLQFASLGDCKLENGEILHGCRVGYRTFGALNESKSNAVLFPTWFTGTSEQLRGNVGAGKLVDPAKFYVILVDALADGVSSSPSNSKLQPRMRFPKVSIRDMVNSQYRLVTETLKLSRLHAVMGISMGGMQTFQWLVSYPDFLDRAVPIVGTPKQTTYDLMLWRAELEATQSDPAWKRGDYRKQPEGAARAVAYLHGLALQTPDFRVRETPSDQFSAYYDGQMKGALGFDANDRIRQLEAMIGLDVFKAFEGNMTKAAQAVHARTLIVVGLRDHMVNPHPALAFARVLNSRTIELDSDCGHLSFSCEQEKVTAAVSRFLEE
jgi:homoserine O-acetyltransferase